RSSCTASDPSSSRETTTRHGRQHTSQSWIISPSDCGSIQSSWGSPHHGHATSMESSIPGRYPIPRRGLENGRDLSRNGAMRGFRWPRELLAALLLCIACARPSSPPPTPTSSSDSTGRSPSEAEASSADVPAPTSGTNAATGDAPDGTTEADRGTTTGWPEATTSEASATTTGDAPPDTSTSGRDEPGETSIATDASTTSPFPDHVTRPRILIVGDSISAGPGCYKGHLRSRLVENGYSDFEFVGPYDDDCGGGVRHGAVSCSTAEQYTQPTFTTPNCGRDSYPGMASLVESHTPDLVMLQLGVNDLWSGRPPESILESYTTLLQQARQHNPNIVMVVARIAKI